MNKMKNKYMKIQILAIVVILLGTLSAYARETHEIHIKLIFKQGPWDNEGYGTNDGRWQATDAFVDSGTVHDDYQMLYELTPNAGMQSYCTMMGKNGLINIRVELGSFTWINPWTIKFEGTWEVVGGTGDYLTASGSGDATQIIVLSAAMNSGEYMVGGPAKSNHVTLVGAIS
jgi:hypothetical protein